MPVCSMIKMCLKLMFESREPTALAAGNAQQSMARG